MSALNSSIGIAMAEAAHGAVLGGTLRNMKERIYEETALRESAEQDIRVLRAKVRALETYIRALKASQAA